MSRDYSNICNPGNLRKAIWELLDENEKLTAKPICKHLGISYKQYKNYVTKERSLWKQWKYYHKFEVGSKCSSVRRCFFDVVLPVGVDGLCRERLGVLPSCGWVLSGNRNRHLIFGDVLGRVQWFETGRVVLFVRRPANFGRAKQLFCNAFTRVGLITDVVVLDKVFEGLRLRGGKADYHVGEKLPYLVIRDFKETNGVTIVLGDRSHPDSVHVIFEYQDQIRKADQLISGFLSQFGEFMNGNGLNGKNGVKPLERDYSV